MSGFDDIAEFTHDIETIFDLVRGGEIAVTKELVNLSLSARDQIKVMLDASEGGKPADDLESKGIISAFRELLPYSSETSDLSEESSEEALSDKSKETVVTYRIRFRPTADIFKNGTNPIFLLKKIREFGSCDIIAQTDAVPLLEDFSPEICYTYWDIILSTSEGINAIRDVFIFVEGDCDINIDVIDDEGGLEDSESVYKRLGQILIEHHDLSYDDLMKGLISQKRIGDTLVDEKVVDRGVVESALAEQEHVRQIRKRRYETALASTIRVPAEKLDTLVDMVGELVTLRARFIQEISLEDKSEEDNSKLVSISEELDRLTEDLRDITMSIRMLPIGTTFSMFRRLVRDLSNELKKEIAMTTEGGDTELDKTVIERLNDPLVHIIRNCIDHGIESPKIREASGKPSQGTVCLSAEHSGADVLIRISDDGAGIDTEVIRTKAVGMGVIAPDAELSESEIFSQIFAPGFSTSEEVTDISGRGVGMDVVKRSIESLRGSIEIASKKGSGTTITLKLPLTLAIIDGFLVKIGEGYFVLPLSSVKECVKLSREDMTKARRRNMINLRGKIILFADLREVFEVEGESPDTERVVITQAKNRSVAFGVDSVIGQHQTVIKTLSKVYKDVKGISGATILGDGTVALILDVTQLVQFVE